MRITFHPQRSDRHLELYRHRDILTINGENFDFGALPNGAELPASAIQSEFIAGPAKRVDGVIHVSIFLPHGPNACDVERFPKTSTLTQNGFISLPAKTGNNHG